MGSPNYSDLSLFERSALPEAVRRQMGNMDRVDVDYSAFDPNDKLALQKWISPGTITEIGGRAIVRADSAEDVEDHEAIA